MFGSVWSGTLFGMSVYPVQVEADMAEGMPVFELVGYLAGEVKEARERVRTALKNSGYPLPPKRITVNLSPADKRKKGASFDLPIAAVLLKTMGALPASCTEKTVVVGELSLNGEVKGVRGVLPMVMEAKRNGFIKCIVPWENAAEGSVVEGIDVYGVRTINDMIEVLNGRGNPQKPGNAAQMLQNAAYRAEHDFSDICGQHVLKRALEVAVCGNHNILMVGPPGAGKSMAASCIPGILPPLSWEECLEISKIYSIAGTLPKEGIVAKRPFICPHHTVSPQALAGGGNVPGPGLVSLSHRGVLFLDELPEFNRSSLEILRQPLEEKEIHISRVNGSYTYPADFLLAAAMNPCKCGYFPNRNKCRCSDTQINAYLSRISRPLLDRIDICVEAAEIKVHELHTQQKEEDSKTVRERVSAARTIQRERFLGTSCLTNGGMNQEEIRKYCTLGRKELHLMEMSYQRLNLTARTYYKILRVARTIADMDGEERIREEHLCEAIGYREIPCGYHV